MAPSSDGRVAIRSYRGVVDEVERRIFRVDRWRLPTPHGVSVRALGYALACLLALALASELPLLGAVLGLLPDSLRLLALPALGGWALAALRIDGRRPHRALLGAARYLALPRSRSGLRSCPRPGSERTPLEAVEIAAVGDGPRLRAGRVRGPARLTLRYATRAEISGGRARGAEAAARLAGARRITLRGAEDPGRPLAVARTLRVPAGREVRLR